MVSALVEDCGFEDDRLALMLIGDIIRASFFFDNEI